MTRLSKRLRRIGGEFSLLHDERGLSTVEYVIILVLIAAAAVATWTMFGKTITDKISLSNKEISENVTITQKGASNGQSHGQAAQPKSDL